MSNRDNKAAAAEFRELVGMEFDEFTRQAPVKVLVALSKFAESVDITVLRLAGESHPLFQQERERLVRALRAARQRKDAHTERRRQMTQIVRNYHNEGGQSESRWSRTEGEGGAPPDEAG